MLQYAACKSWHPQDPLQLRKLKKISRLSLL